MLKSILSSGRWRFIAGGVLGIVVIAGVLLITTFAQAQASAKDQEQPIAFNHEIMVQLGIGCLYCHSDARRSPTAGMPSVEKCMGCHAQIDPQNPEIVKLATYWKNQQPIPWVRVNHLPRFVYFSHEVHVTAGGLQCETCHGDVGHMKVDRPVVQMNMGWCLSCHQKQPNHTQLVECITCHQ